MPVNRLRVDPDGGGFGGALVPIDRLAADIPVTTPRVAATVTAMSLRMQCVAIDARDPEVLARFWAEALGWRIIYSEPDEWVIEPAEGSPEDGVAADLIFLAVPEGKQAKNRLHLDLRPDDQDAEVARLLGLGATRADVGQGADKTWVVLADPEGNEFCVLRALRPDER